jgi:hypothetical protein
MSGPPFPHQNPAPGSNAIGRFTIGVSPIGTLPTFDFWRTIISQYANSPIIPDLIADFAQYVDPTANIESFFDLIFNVDTAVGYGLDVWGRIVGVSRTLTVGVVTYFGFAEATPGVENFGPFSAGGFYTGATVTNNYSLPDADYRRLILVKAAANITDCSIPALNRILLSLFPNRGNCYVIDNNDMTMVYRFEFALSPVDLAIVQGSGVLPKPVGVSATVVQL